jgi:hypothetical protein
MMMGTGGYFIAEARQTHYILSDFGRRYSFILYLCGSKN